MTLLGPEPGSRLVSGSIVGIGFDLVDVARIERAVTRWGEAFLTHVYTGREIRDSGTGPGRCERLAARFCAKEAVFKALGLGRPALGWHDVEVVKTPTGRPEIVLGGRALEVARRRSVGGVLVTLSHTKELAAAQALCLDAGPVLEGNY